MTGGGSEEGCTYVFDPDEWHDEHGTSSRLSDLNLDDGRWHCPHPATDEHEYCLFHQPPDETDPDRVTERFLERISAPGKRPKQFLGAEFGEMNLEHAILESADNHPIDLRHAQFHGRLDWEYSIVRQPIAFDGAVFHDAARFDETTFLGDAFFSGARFATDSKAYFLEATFAKAAIFYDVTCPGDTSFFSAEFGGRVDFIQSQFERVNFREVTFERRARFKEAMFEHAEFSATTFHEGAEFEGASFRIRLAFDTPTSTAQHASGTPERPQHSVESSCVTAPFPRRRSLTPPTGRWCTTCVARRSETSNRETAPGRTGSATSTS